MEGNAFESENGVAVVQTSKVKLGGHCSELYCRPAQKPQAGVVLSQNAGAACILFNGHGYPCTVPVRCLTFRP